jgi:pimeloyl-ACP methyl ester carboxylesterase
MIDEPLRLAVPTGLQVLGRITGNENSNSVLIFSHGFGVKSDSRGMFNKIVAEFQEKFLTVRFHYVSIDDFSQDTYVTSYSDQINKLTTVVEKIRTRYPDKTVIFLAHSQGCWITSAYIARGGVVPVKHILMAPSPTINVASRMKVKLEGREGSVLNAQGISTFPRTDGSKTYILSSFWQDAEKIVPMDLMCTAANAVSPVVIWGTKDELRNAKDFETIKAELKPIRVYELPNGHDFSEDDVIGLVAVLSKELAI